ncbi:hypothetical protein L6164_005925 [Bauhinia variegata]|uniref:Uncharacterized protein n=1 Tax=Bauhinia variegata TaxID=167791 RepID=A0ACB9PSW4_BAUVA|nr:hypothetical protein L6164_005925 [Bauhinia variegata]
MGLPFTNHHGGQILFAPKDGYLYFMMGDGGSRGDPYNFSQNKKSLLGKILRLDVDNIPGAQTISDLSLWGNYSIPRDNPFSEDKELQPEIWALALNLRAQYEEVDIVTKGGNYGWRVYEGPFLYNPPNSPGGNTSASTIDAIFPVMGYNHSDANAGAGSASITGGFFYRSSTDPCIYGRYLYADLYAGAIWTGVENPQGSGNFTSSNISVLCALDSPIECSDESVGSVPALGYIFSFGQDNRKDIFILASSGLYRIARPSRCNLFCSKQNETASRPPSSAPSPSNGCHHLSISLSQLLFISPLWLLFTFW